MKYLPFLFYASGAVLLGPVVIYFGTGNWQYLFGAFVFSQAGAVLMTAFSLKLSAAEAEDKTRNSLFIPAIFYFMPILLPAFILIYFFNNNIYVLTGAWFFSLGWLTYIYIRAEQTRSYQAKFDSGEIQPHAY